MADEGPYADLGAAQVQPAPEADEREHHDLAVTIWRAGGITTDDADDAADRVLAAGYRRSQPAPRTVTAGPITTVEALDALTRTALVRTPDGQVWERMTGGWDCLSANGTGGVETSSTVLHQSLPPRADLLYRPALGITVEAPRG